MLGEAGYDARDAGVRLSWGQPEVPELRVSDMLMAYEKGAIGLEEVRGILAGAGWELGGRGA